MGFRIGAGIGILAGSLMTARRIIDAHKAGWDVADTAQSCFSGYSFVKGDHDVSRMVFTIPVAVGVAASAIASKTGANRYTPKGINI